MTASPPTIEMSGRDYAAYPIELPEVGPYRSVNLAPDVSRLPSAAHARKVARTMAPLFRDAVTKARRDVTVRDPSRRRLLRARPARVDAPRGAMVSKAL